MIILHSFMYEHSFKSTKGRVKGILTGFLSKDK